MQTGKQAALADIKDAAERLVAAANELGVVVTIEQVPVEPLEMGRYVSTVSVREARREVSQ